MLLTITVAAAAVGIALLAAGLRGRRVDDHPLCRRCRFDLTGKPAESTRCSECGAPIDRPNAVRVGHRQHRPRAVAYGAAVLLPVTAFSALTASDFYRGRASAQAAHLKYKVFVYGDFDLSHTGRPNVLDAATVRRAIVRSGGTVTVRLGVDDDFAVLGVEPTLPKLHGGTGISDNSVDVRSAQEAREAIDRYQNVRTDAIRSSIPLLPAERFLRRPGYYDQSHQ